jgi:hypothetical protein
MWNYIEIENFFSEEDLNFLLLQVNKIDVSKTKDNEMTVYSNKIFCNGKVESSIVDEESLLKLNRKYTPILLDYLRSIAPKKLSFFDHADFHFVVQGKNYSHHNHEDDYRKLLSVVVYLAPEKNFGTVLFSDKRKNNLKSIEWKINKAFIFSREENKTWHSFKSDGINERYTLVYNLQMVDDERALRKEILRAEGHYFYEYLIKKMLLLPYVLGLRFLDYIGMRRV